MNGLRRCVAILASCSLTCCGSSITPPSVVEPTPLPPTVATPCSAWPGPEAIHPGWPVPNPSQAAACLSNERPRFEQVVAERRLEGVQVTWLMVDPDSGSACDAVYMNGRYRSGGWGGVGRGLSFHNRLTFPVEVRLVAWDEQGCLAVPVCLVVQ
jgi:hypothetical protein